MNHIAIFASGSGTNAQNIIEYFEKKYPKCNYSEANAPIMGGARAEIVICNKADAYVLERVEKLGVPSVVLTKEELTTSPERLFGILAEYGIDFIILAGYLLKIPAELIKKYHNRIINIHPALLPKYGGKGMYGHHVHEAVVAAGEEVSGITIHLVDEKYDNGSILFQAKCRIAPDDTPNDVAAKIHQLEQAHFPKVIEEYMSRFDQK